MFVKSTTGVKKLSATLLLFSLLFSFTACDSDGNGGFLGSGAPDALGVCTFSWSERYNGYGESNQLFILDVNSCQASWSVTRGSYSYTKTGENTAHLSFSVTQYVVGNTRSFQYSLDLTFASNGQFELTGSKVIVSSLTGTVRRELTGEGTLVSGIVRD